MNDGISAAKNISDGASDHEMLATMRTRLMMAIDAYSDNREDQLDDLRFYAGSPDNQWQWPADVLATPSAELSSNEKNRLSHRGRAMAELKRRLGEARV